MTTTLAPPVAQQRATPARRVLPWRATGSDPASAVVDSSLPLFRILEAARSAQREGAATVWVSGANAAPVAARLTRLVQGLRVGVEVRPEDDLAATARDLVALAGIAGGRAAVLVADASARLGLVVALKQEFAHGARPYPAHFGGDAFTATIRLPWPVELEVHGEPAGPLTVSARTAVSAPN